MMNDTMRKFGHPGSLVADFEHWAVLVRPEQPTAGALVLAAKSAAEAFGDLPPTAFAELGAIIPRIEAALRAAVDYAKINYLMLMMVDRQVHFHVLPRYAGARTLAGVTVTDAGWPAAPQLGTATALDDRGVEAMVAALEPHFR